MSRVQNRASQLLLFLSLALAWGACAAQSAEPGEPIDDTFSDAIDLPPSPALPHTDALGPIERRLYPPGLVMDHQNALALDEAQRAAILDEVRAAQRQLVELDANLRRDTESLGALLDAAPIDEPAALAAAERVAAWETQIKAVHLRMLVRIKNQLTPEQRASLDRLR